MDHTLEQICTLARSLTNEETMQLVELLVAEVDGVEAEVHESWKDEVARRIDADRNGHLETYEYADVMKKYFGE